VCTVSIFAALLGYDIGVMAGALLPMSRDLDFTSSQKEVAVGCLNFISAVGALGAGVVYHKQGAVKCVKFAVVLYAVGMFIIALSGSFSSVFFGRLVCGLGVGLGFAICPQYIAEISPPEWRGVLVSMFEISINVGLLSGYLANLALENFEDSRRWRGLILLPTAPTLLTYAFLVPKLPESPRWLLRDGAPGKEALAREVLVKTCGAEAAGPALADIKQVVAAQQESNRVAVSSGGDGQYHKKNTGWRSLLFDPAPRRALLIGAGTAFFQQANGSEAAVYYVPQVLAAAGVKSEHSQLQAAALVGVCKTICIVIGQFSVDVYGRRLMLLSSVGAVTASLALLSWCLGNVSTDDGATGATAGITLAALCLFMMSFSLGVGPVTWVVTSEIFPIHVRSKGTAFSMALNRLTSGTVAMTFLTLTEWLTVAGAFALFTCVSATQYVLTYLFLPETKGKTLEEIEASLVGASGNGARGQYDRVDDEDEA
jgi:sugar porter (SP) family MFS transporter